MKETKQMEKGFYIAGWCLLAIALGIAWAVKISGVDVFSLVPPCLFRSLTGLYCPGCGGTRALRALLQGKLLQSFHEHPIVPYTAIVGGWFMLSQTIERLSGGRLRIGLRFCGIYLWIALGIVVVNVLLRNFILILS